LKVFESPPEEIEYKIDNNDNITLEEEVSFSEEVQAALKGFQANVRVSSESVVNTKSKKTSVGKAVMNPSLEEFEKERRENLYRIEQINSLSQTTLSVVLINSFCNKCSAIRSPNLPDS
jgi:hypothetical protein